MILEFSRKEKLKMLPIINLQAVNRTAHTEYMGAPKKKRRVTTTIICWNQFQK